MRNGIWIRRCTSCGTDDLDAACGRAALPAWDEAWWNCPTCGGRAWEAAALVMPDGADVADGADGAVPACLFVQEGRR